MTDHAKSSDEKGLLSSSFFDEQQKQMSDTQNRVKAPPLEPGNILNGRYLVDRRIGSGAMGQIYKCFDLRQKEKVVAVKRLTALREENIRRFTREYKFLGTIEHSNLIKAHDFFESNECLYMTLEFARGNSMAEYLRQKQRTFSFSEQLAIANKVARGVEVLNAGGILHRDIKPANIMIDAKAGEVKVVDLGVGKDVKNLQSYLTKKGAIVGSLPYASPEQINGTLSAYSDIFSLGVTLYQFFLWSENSPFYETTPYLTICRIGEETLPLLAEKIELIGAYEHIKKAYQQLDDILARATAKNPEERCSAGEMAYEMARIYENLFSENQENEKRLTISSSLSPELLNKLKAIKEESHEIEFSRQQTLKNFQNFGKQMRSKRLAKKTTHKKWPIYVVGAVLLFLAIAFFANKNSSHKKPYIPAKTFISNKLKENKVKAEKHFFNSIRAFYQTKDYQKAWEENQKACDFVKDKKYLFHRAKMLYLGKGIKKDMQQALALIKEISKVKNNQDSFILYMLGWIYKNSVGVEQDYERAANYYWKAARRNNIPAIAEIASMFEQGLGIPQDYSQALYWLHQAASKEDPEILNKLGLMYEQGQGVPHDFRKARQLYEKAISKGNIKAMYNLGYIYLLGKGIAKNEVKAFEFFRKAAVRGLAPAMTDLGYMYAQGKGTAENHKEAVIWYHKAAKQNNARAMVNLGHAYEKGEGVEVDDKQAVYWYQQASNLNYTQAMNNLGFMYTKGKGVEKNYKKAMHWYRLSAKQGNSHAMFNLGKMLEAGTATPINLSKAERWYRRALRENPNSTQLRVALQRILNKQSQKK